MNKFTILSLNEDNTTFTATRDEEEYIIDLYGANVPLEDYIGSEIVVTEYFMFIGQIICTEWEEVI